MGRQRLSTGLQCHRATVSPAVHRRGARHGLATALGWGNAVTIALAVVLAFVFGYAVTMTPLLRSGLTFRPRSAAM